MLTWCCIRGEILLYQAIREVVALRRTSNILRTGNWQKFTPCTNWHNARAAQGQFGIVWVRFLSQVLPVVVPFDISKLSNRFGTCTSRLISPCVTICYAQHVVPTRWGVPPIFCPFISSTSATTFLCRLRSWVAK